MKNKCCNCKYWQIRNNSANVAAALHPENLQKCPNDLHFLSGNNCYCREKKIPPQLFPNPKHCICQEYENDEVMQPRMHHERVFVSKYETPSFKIREVEPSHQNGRKDFGVFKMIKSKPDHQTHDFSIFNNLSSHQIDSRGKIVSEMDRTKSHTVSKKPEVGDFETYYYNDKDYYKTATTSGYPEESLTESDPHLISENAKNDVSKKITTNIERPHQSRSDYLRDKNGFKSDQDRNQTYFEEASQFFDLETQNAVISEKDDNVAQKYDKPSEATLNPEDIPQNKQIENFEKSDLKRLSDFRNDHYFETHSTEDLMKSVPEHICVHSFGLDNRLLPEPLHSDVYGVSRCIICGKPMETQPINKIDERMRTGKNIFPKFYKYGLAPKKIYMAGDKNIQVEVKMPCGSDLYRMKAEKRPEYFNTYALRYQKGVA